MRHAVFGAKAGTPFDPRGFCFQVGGGHFQLQPVIGKICFQGVMAQLRGQSAQVNRLFGHLEAHVGITPRRARRSSANS